MITAYKAGANAGDYHYSESSGSDPRKITKSKA